MARITKVPNGPLVKKKGPYAGSTLKKGGVIKKAQDGFNKVKPGTKQTPPKFRVPESRFVITNDTAKVKPTRWVDNPMPSNDDDSPFKVVRDVLRKKDMTNKKTGGKIKKAQNGDTLSVKKPTWQQMTAAERGAKKTELVKQGGMDRFKQYKDSVSADASNRANKMFEKNAATRGMTVEELRKSNARDAKKPNAPQEGLCDPNFSSTKCGISKAAAKESKKDWKTKKNGGPIKKAKAGAMIKRADGSMSKRGLWDNIRANKGSGKKPTKQMLVQEKKIKAKSKK